MGRNKRKASAEGDNTQKTDRYTSTPEQVDWTEQSKTSANSKGQMTNSPEKVKKRRKKAFASQGKGAEKKKVQIVREKTQEVTEKTGKEVGEKEDRNKAVEKKADKSKTFEKKADKSITVVNREEKGVQRTSIKRKVTGAGMFSFSWTRDAQRDTEEYRNGYPTIQKNKKAMKRLLTHTR